MSYTRRSKDELAARVAQDIPEGVLAHLETVFGQQGPDLLAEAGSPQQQPIIESETGMTRHGRYAGAERRLPVKVHAPKLRAFLQAPTGCAGDGGPYQELFSHSTPVAQF